MYSAHLGITQDVDQCFLITHSLVILDSYLHGDCSDISTYYSIKAGTPFTLPFTDFMVFIMDVLNYQWVEM